MLAYHLNEWVGFRPGSQTNSLLQAIGYTFQLRRMDARRSRVRLPTHAKRGAQQTHARRHMLFMVKLVAQLQTLEQAVNSHGAVAFQQRHAALIFQQISDGAFVTHLLKELSALRIQRPHVLKASGESYCRSQMKEQLGA